MVRTSPPRTTSRICRSRSISTPLPLSVALGRMPAASALRRLRPDDAVTAQARRLLERPDGLLGQRPERPVGRAQPVAQRREPLLQGEHLGARSRRASGWCAASSWSWWGWASGRRRGRGGRGDGRRGGLARRGGRGSGWASRCRVGVAAALVAEVGARGRCGVGRHRGVHDPPSDPQPGEQHGRSGQRGRGRRHARAPGQAHPSPLRSYPRSHTTRDHQKTGRGPVGASQRAGRDRLVARPRRAA